MRGGPPLSFPTREIMVHMSQNLRMPADHITMFIPSPRVDGPVHVKTVKNVLDRHEVFSTVAVLRTPRRVKDGPAPHPHASEYRQTGSFFVSR